MLISTIHQHPIANDFVASKFKNSLTTQRFLIIAALIKPLNFELLKANLPLWLAKNIRQSNNLLKNCEGIYEKKSS